MSEDQTKSAPNVADLSARVIALESTVASLISMLQAEPNLRIDYWSALPTASTLPVPHK